MSVRVRDAPGVSWGYPQSSRLKTYPFEQGVPRFWYKLVVEVPASKFPNRLKEAQVVPLH